MLETYVISGSIFDFTSPIDVIGKNDRNGISIPVPSHFFKSVLTKEKNGKLKIWSFEMANKSLSDNLEDYRVSTTYIEQRTGILLWDNLTGPEIEKMKKRIRSMW